MSIWEAILMGVVQGLTEFLPVSSSGYLEIANVVLGIEAEQNLAFTTVVHGGPGLSTIVVLWKYLGRVLSKFFTFKPGPELRFGINILVSALPILVVGMFFKDQVETLFTGNLLLVGVMLLVTAALLTFSQYAKPRHREMNIRDAFVIGIAQAVAVLPGLSRSGSTIPTGLLLGLRREDVASFSFLMALIPIIGANILEITGGGFAEASATIGAGALIAGFLASFLVGTLACKLMINLVKRGKLIWFAVYCALVWLVAVGYSLF